MFLLDFLIYVAKSIGFQKYIICFFSLSHPVGTYTGEIKLKLKLGEDYQALWTYRKYITKINENN